MSKRRLQVASNFPLSPRFCQALVNQLTDQARELAGLDISQFYIACKETILIQLEQNGQLVTETRKSPFFDQNNTGGLAADIVGPDNMGGHLAYIAWRCTAHPGERIEPDNPLKPAEGHQLQIWWVQFPMDELRAEYLIPPPPHTIEVGDVSFEIKWSPWWEPPTETLTFELYTRRQVSDDALEAAEQLVWQEVTRYRPRVDDEVWQLEAEHWGLSEDAIMSLASRGFANDWLGIQHRKGRKYCIYVDFIIMNDQIVAEWLRAIDKASDILSIVRVAVEPY